MAILALLFGLISWGIPLYYLIANKFSFQHVAFSLGFAMLSLFTIFNTLLYWIEAEDWAAIMDVYPTARLCAILLVIGVLAFNILSWLRRNRDKTA